MAMMVFDESSGLAAALHRLINCLDVTTMFDFTFAVTSCHRRVPRKPIDGVSVGSNAGNPRAVGPTNTDWYATWLREKTTTQMRFECATHFSRTTSNQRQVRADREERKRTGATTWSSSSGDGV